MSQNEAHQNDEDQTGSNQTNDQNQDKIFLLLRILMSFKFLLQAKMRSDSFALVSVLASRVVLRKPPVWRTETGSLSGLVDVWDANMRTFPLSGLTVVLPVWLQN